MGEAAQECVVSVCSVRLPAVWIHRYSAVLLFICKAVLVLLHVAVNFLLEINVLQKQLCPV